MVSLTRILEEPGALTALQVVAPLTPAPIVQALWFVGQRTLPEATPARRRGVQSAGRDLWRQVGLARPSLLWFSFLWSFGACRQVEMISSARGLKSGYQGLTNVLDVIATLGVAAEIC